MITKCYSLIEFHAEHLDLSIAHAAIQTDKPK